MSIGLLLHPYGEKSPGGLGRFVFEMTKALLEHDTKSTYTLYFKETDVPRPPFKGEHWSYRGLGSNLLWLTGAFKMDRSLDLYVFFTPIIPLFFRPKRAVVLALDFAYWKLRSGSLKDELSAQLLFFLQKRSLSMADHIVAISEETRADVIELFGIPPERVSVVRLSCVPLGDEKKEIATPELFFLFAGVLKERKNVAGIIRAFALFAKTNATHELLISGKQGGGYADSLVTLARELGVSDRVRFLGYVSNAELAYLYSKAQALVFPSFIEGFGMPVLEAMQAGLPVITSHTGALSEIGEGAAVLVDPHTPAAIAAAMSRVATDESFRQELISRGRTRAAEFSWQRSAEMLSAVCTKAIALPTSSVPTRDRVLDAWRGIAILLVIVHHQLYFHLAAVRAFAASTETYGLTELARLFVKGVVFFSELAGPLGVKIFFVVSGYIITRLMLEEEARRGAVRLGAFYVRRAFRILPPYFVYLAAVILATWFGLVPLPWHDVVVAALFACNLGPECGWQVVHTWTLAVEMQFYLVWPLVFLLLPARRRAAFLASVIAVLILLSGFSVGLARGWIDNAASFACIALGALYAISPRVQLWVSRYGMRSIGWGVLAVFFLVMVQAGATAHVVYRMLLPLSITTIVFLVYRQEKLDASPLVWALSRIGLVSYSLYLWQQVFSAATDNYLTASPLSYAPLMIGACLLSYFLVEKPSIKAGKRLTAWLGAKR